MYSKNLNRVIAALCLFLALLCLEVTAHAQSEEEMQVLRMYFREDELVVTPTRQPKPVSQVAEDISVVTSKEIEEMNAHTLSDVLMGIPGVQIANYMGPGSAVAARIQGSEVQHVLVMMDGVMLNNLSDNVADIGSIPVQNIERIEIIKGPASSSWGSSLGGIINIITKSPEEERKIGGTLFGSYGEKETADVRAEVSGTVGDIGYYMYAGNLTTEGFRQNTAFYSNYVYAKLQWQASDRARILFTFGYNEGNRGVGEQSDFDLSQKNEFENLFSTLSLSYAITDNADFTLSLRTSRKDNTLITNELSTGERLDKSTFGDKNDGGSARFTWAKGIHSLVVGADYDNGTLKSNRITGGEQTLEKWAVFANDTITVKKFSFTPGIRYDHTSTNGDFVSPSLGVTYKLTDTTMLRGYIARGFSIPPLTATFGNETVLIEANPDLDVEKVNSYQLGVESTAVKYLWVRASLFRHDIKDAIDTEVVDTEVTPATQNDEPPSFKVVNKGKFRRQGFELEAKTIPVYNTSLFAGFAFVDAENRDTGERVQGVGRYTYDVGLLYNDNKSFKALLKGHYVWWDDSSDFNGKYTAFIWDLNLMKKIYMREKTSAEIFLSVHNIFNGAQYVQESFKNPRRWVEGGMRFKF